MINSTAFDYVNVLTKAADASYQREAILANNISNVDTPGYKRKDLNFEGVLSQELGRCKHQSLDKKISELDTSKLTANVYTDHSNYSYRMDGNNVDIDTENVELASEQIKYEALTSSISSQSWRFNDMGLFQAFNISASGMTAERFRTDIIAQNIANVNTTSTKEGTPYRRKIVTFSEKNVTPFSQIYSSSKKAAVGNGVKVSSVTSDYSTDFIKEYDPSNPDADADGYVSYPNVNTVTEMTNLIDATRAYEANATAFEASKSMAQNGLQIGK